MATVELKAKARTETGKGIARQTRREGSFPAILYGEGEEPQALSVDNKDFYPVIRTAAGENVILDLRIEGAKQDSCKAIIRDIQYHPVKRDILHVDFQHISMTKMITVNVPIEIVGESVGVKVDGGILEVILREVEVECLPVNIPDVIKVDVTELEIGNSIQVSDLSVEEATIVADPGATVITIGAPTVVEEVKPEVPEGEEAAEEGAEEGAKAAEGAEAKSEEPAKGEDTEKKAEK
jgi:large subunit ribosomal protein L25